METRSLVEGEVRKMAEKTGIRISDVVSFAGIPKSTWHEWKGRRGIKTRHNHETPKHNWYTMEKKRLS